MFRCPHSRSLALRICLLVDRKSPVGCLGRKSRGTLRRFSLFLGIIIFYNGIWGRIPGGCAPACFWGGRHQRTFPDRLVHLVHLLRYGSNVAPSPRSIKRNKVEEIDISWQRAFSLFDLGDQVRPLLCGLRRKNDCKVGGQTPVHKSSEIADAASMTEQDNQWRGNV